MEAPYHLAVGETCHAAAPPPLPSVGVSIVLERAGQQNDRTLTRRPAPTPGTTSFFPPTSEANISLQPHSARVVSVRCY